MYFSEPREVSNLHNKPRARGEARIRAALKRVRVHERVRMRARAQVAAVDTLGELL